MRASVSRVVLVLIVAALLLAPLVACGKEPYYEFDDGDKDRIETTTGTDLKLTASLRTPRTPGCACTSAKEGYDSEPISAVDYSVEPADGAAVSSSGVFTATRPGTYRVMVSGRYGSATTTVVVSGEQLPEEEGPPVETEEPAEDPLVGLWSWMPYWAQQKWTAEGGVSENEWEWVAGQNAAEFSITASGGGYTLGGWLSTSSITADGTHVLITNSSPGWQMTLDGTVSGDTITGTQTYVDEHAGTLSLEWVATRVQ